MFKIEIWNLLNFEIYNYTITQNTKFYFDILTWRHSNSSINGVTSCFAVFSLFGCLLPGGCTCTHCTPPPGYAYERRFVNRSLYLGALNIHNGRVNIHDQTRRWNVRWDDGRRLRRLTQTTTSPSYFVILFNLINRLTLIKLSNRFIINCFQ